MDGIWENVMKFQNKKWVSHVILFLKGILLNICIHSHSLPTKKEINQYHRYLKDEVLFNCMICYFWLYIQWKCTIIQWCRSWCYSLLFLDCIQDTVGKFYYCLMEDKTETWSSWSKALTIYLLFPKWSIQIQSQCSKCVAGLQVKYSSTAQHVASALFAFWAHQRL